MKKYIISLIVIIILVLSATACNNIPESGTLTLAEVEKPEIKKAERIDAPVFSLKEFFYDENKTLEFTYTDEFGAYQIYYTTDGTIPTSESELYTEPIEIESTRKIVLFPYRARALHEDGTWSNITYHTYIFGKFVNIDRFNTLVISLSTDPYNLYDYEYGILIEGKLRDEWRAANPRAEVSPPMPANFNMRGKSSERPVHVEMFTPDGERVINQNGGVRVYGGWSRANRLKSLKVYARNDYDPIGWFNYSFYGEDYDYEGNQITRYKRFVVRNAGNDHQNAYVRDELFHTLARDAGFPDTERVTPVSVFVNGEYFGCYWMHDVYCDQYFEQRYGDYEGHFTVLGIAEQNKEANEDDEEEQEAAADYREMYRYSRRDLTDEAVYAELCEVLDVENYMMYCAINAYIDNNDWPHNNNRSYRYFAAEGEEYRDEMPFDGKWRYMMHDSDYSSGIYGLSHTTNTVRKILAKNVSPMLLALMQRDDCKEFFVKYMLDLLNGAFAEDNFIARLNKLHASRVLEMDMYLATSKYAPNMSMGTVTSGVKTLKEFAANRPAAMIRNLRIALNTTEETYDINIINESEYGIAVNTYTTYNKKFTGTYISDYYTTIKAEIPEDKEFSHWIVNGNTVNDEVLEIIETSEITLILK
jgi:CotH protein.